MLCVQLFSQRSQCLKLKDYTEGHHNQHGFGSMLHRPEKQQATRKSGEPGGESLHDYLLRELPPGKAKEASYVAEALTTAAERYDCRTAKRDEWRNYASRRERLEGIGDLAGQLASRLCKLDFISREELQNRLGPKELEAIVGSLGIVITQTSDLAQGIQTNGKPRNVAEERWILELADIYENAFCRPATVSGSGDEPARRRGKFYRLLQLSRPPSFPRHGKLSLRHIKQVLAQRPRRVTTLTFR
jgi:hypothetical protein